MIVFLFFSLFPLIRTDCLEFNQTSRINRCFIINIEHDSEQYYPRCLQCTIETYIEPDDIHWKEENQCLILELQCIQMKFPTREIFEDFFGSYQRFILDLFFQDNGTDRNTLHVIIEKNSLEEINVEYIEQVLQFNALTYRVFFLELHLHNQIIRINRDLINLIHLSMKLILICEDEIPREETIYLIHNRNIILESQSDSCPALLIPSTSTITIPLTTMIEVLPISPKKSQSIVLLIVLVTGVLLSLCIGMSWYCWKRLKYRYRRLSEKLETMSESSLSQDETPQEPIKLNSKPHRGIRALQLLDDDI